LCGRLRVRWVSLVLRNPNRSRGKSTAPPTNHTPQTRGAPPRRRPPPQPPKPMPHRLGWGFQYAAGCVSGQVGESPLGTPTPPNTQPAPKQIDRRTPLAPRLARAAPPRPNPHQPPQCPCPPRAPSTRLRRPGSTPHHTPHSNPPADAVGAGAAKQPHRPHEQPPRRPPTKAKHHTAPSNPPTDAVGAGPAKRPHRPHKQPPRPPHRCGWRRPGQRRRCPAGCWRPAGWRRARWRRRPRRRQRGRARRRRGCRPLLGWG
jgi:hypothetical protein